jgi:hypothetical protein
MRTQTIVLVAALAGTLTSAARGNRPADVGRLDDDNQRDIRLGL